MSPYFFSSFNIKLISDNYHLMQVAGTQVYLKKTRFCKALYFDFDRFIFHCTTYAEFTLWELEMFC